MGNNTEGVVKYIAPKDVPLAHLWLVVMGAPTEHWMNPISGEKDAQWPYKIKITGSSYSPRQIERFIWNPHFFFEFSLFFLRKVVILHKI